MNAPVGHAKRRVVLSRSIVRTLSLTCLLLALAAPAPTGATDFSGWAKSAKVTFSGYDRPETLINFPVLIVLGTNISGFVYNDFSASNGGDLRFAAGDGVTELNYEIDTWNTTSNSYVWVQVPTLSSTSDCIWVYWGNAAQATAPAYTTNGAVWSNSYVGVWHMRESSGNLANSATGGTTNNGVSVGTRPVSASCLIGNGQYNASQGTGDGNGFNVGNFPVFSGKSNITIEAIFKATGDSSLVYEKMVCSRNETVGQYNYTLGKNDNGYTRMCVATNGGAEGVENIAPYSANNWHYLAGVYNGITNARVAVDGSYYYDTNIPPGLVIHDTSTPAYRTYLFARYTMPSQNFVGYLDEVRLSTVSRSTNWLWATWRTALSNSQFQTYGAATLQGGLPPTIANLAPTNITTSSAFMNGSLLATNGSPVTAMAVLWGTTDGGVTATAWSHTNAFAPGPWSEGSTFTTNITLPANSDCYYTYTAVNGSGPKVAPSSQYFITGELNVQATDPLCASNAADTATFVVTRPAACTGNALPVNLALSGAASNGVDYTAGWTGGSATIPAGQTTATLTITPMITVQNYLATKNIVVTLNPGNYAIGAANSATGNFQSFPTPSFIWDTNKNGATVNFENPAYWIPTNLFLNHISQVCDMNAGSLAGYGSSAGNVPPFAAQLNINSNATLSSGTYNSLTFSNLHLRGGTLVGQVDCSYHGHIAVDNASVLNVLATDAAAAMAAEFSGSGNLCVSNGTSTSSGYLWWPFTANNTNYSGVWTFYNAWPGRLDFVGNMGTGGLNFTPMSSNVWISANTACPWTLDLRGGQVQMGVSSVYPSPAPGTTNPIHTGTFTLLSDAIIRAGGPGGGVIATINGRITGVGKLGTKAISEDNPSPANAIKLGGTNDYSGGTVVLSNVLEAAAAGSLGSGNVEVQPGGKLQVDVAGTLAQNAYLYLDFNGTTNGILVTPSSAVTTTVSRTYIGGSGGWSNTVSYTRLPSGLYTATTPATTNYLTGAGALVVASAEGTVFVIR